MRSYRYASHAAVLLMAMAMANYSAVNINMAFAPRTGTLTAEADQPGGVVFGRDGTIIKPVAIPTAPLPNRKPIRYTVKDGDTLDSIARRFSIPLRDITWSNPGLRLPLVVGKTLMLPPVPGVVIVAKPGDSAESLGATYGADPTTVLGFNSIRASQLTPGTVLVIPVDPQSSPNLSNGKPADPVLPGQLMCPIRGAEIIQKFGPTSFALEPAYGGFTHFHSGVDLLAEYGTAITAAAGGKVTATGFADYFGLRVEVTDSYGLVEIYAHMADVSVAVGQPIQQGQKVGSVGSTGLSIGSHLHLQLEIGHLPSDPLPLMGC